MTLYSAKKAKLHSESHLINRIGWLRAGILGANDGILSTASLVSGMAAGGAPRSAILLAGIAGLMAGAGSMATGEYVSVSSQADMEAADMAREQRELTLNPAYETEELAQIYMTRGVDAELSRRIAAQLMAHDALGAHARDELGISDLSQPRPLQAAMASAASFICGAALPLLVAVVAPATLIGPVVVGSTLLSLATLGALGARTGGVAVMRPMMRVVFWGVVSLGLTVLAGHLFAIG